MNRQDIWLTEDANKLEFISNENLISCHNNLAELTFPLSEFMMPISLIFSIYLVNKRNFLSKLTYNTITKYKNTFQWATSLSTTQT